MAIPSRCIDVGGKNLSMPGSKPQLLQQLGESRVGPQWISYGFGGQIHQVFAVFVVCLIQPLESPIPVAQPRPYDSNVERSDAALAACLLQLGLDFSGCRSVARAAAQPLPRRQPRPLAGADSRCGMSVLIR